MERVRMLLGRITMQHAIAVLLLVVAVLLFLIYREVHKIYMLPDPAPCGDYYTPCHVQIVQNGY